MILTVQSQSLKLVLKRAVRPVCSIADRINKGWYLEQGALTGLKSKAITRQVDKLCHEVRQEAVQLVDSFGIPDHASPHPSLCEKR